MRDIIQGNINVLICNVGSTSLKYQLFDMDHQEKVLAKGRAERVGSALADFFHEDKKGKETLSLPLPTHKEAIEQMLEFLTSRVIDNLEDISCVGFKVVHGGMVTGVQELNEDVLTAMAKLNTIAPAHNPPYISAIRQFASLIPGIPLIGSFETGFHATMPPKAYLYSLPVELYKEHGVRRYGFHGASHEYVSAEVQKRMGRKDLKLISCHLGGSGSLCAVKNGESIDTTLGFSLQCGTMHNNRIGDIDPYITFFLNKDLGLSLDEIDTIYSKKSGLLGLSGVSGDLRDVEQAAQAGNEDAANALETYCYQIKKYIGSYAAAMGGLDVIAFAGGIGENSQTVRQKVCEDLQFLGVVLDTDRNQHPGTDGIISSDQSAVSIYRIFTNEEIVVARKALQYLQNNSK